MFYVVGAERDGGTVGISACDMPIDDYKGVGHVDRRADMGIEEQGMGIQRMMHRDRGAVA